MKTARQLQVDVRRTCGAGIGPMTLRGMGFQPMQHRQDADATSLPNAHLQLP